MPNEHERDQARADGERRLDRQDLSRPATSSFEAWFARIYADGLSSARMFRVKPIAREAFAAGAQSASADVVHAAIVKLSPWSQHHSTCARNTDAADCDCGLQDTLQEVDPVLRERLP